MIIFLSSIIFFMAYGIVYQAGRASSQEPPALEPPLVRDDVVILVGPDKGKTGRVLWVARVDGKPKCLGVRFGSLWVEGLEGSKETKQTKQPNQATQPSNQPSQPTNQPTNQPSQPTNQPTNPANPQPNNPTNHPLSLQSEFLMQRFAIVRLSFNKDLRDSEVPRHATAQKPLISENESKTFGCGSKGYPKNTIGKRKHRSKLVVPRALFFDPLPFPTDSIQPFLE